ncbi:E3 ubiquitin-protein ligase rad18 [Blastocladiella emersonii ATCC 22665]|nr:E3 ubiquitin-protein ligase rad18 [Blastocladiella emersonii ATCC 22665]
MDHTQLVAASAAAFQSTLDALDDPSDWPAAHKHAGDLDTHLRCSMCYELYKTPLMVVGCWHTFCSRCIRERITSTDTSCPSCRRDIKERDLVPHRVLDDIVESFRLARPGLLKAANAPAPAAAAAGSRSTPSSSTRSAAAAAVSTPPSASRATRPRRAAASYAAIPDDSGSESSTSSSDSLPPPTPGPRKRARPNPAPADEDDDPDIVIVRDTPAGNGDDGEDDDDDTCFVCHERYPAGVSRDAHVGACIDLQESRAAAPARPAKRPKPSPAPASPSSTPSAYTDSSGIPTKRLPRGFYSVYKDAQLRALLDEHGLPTTGRRDQLMDRHRQWVRLWNANIDAPVHRRDTVAQLRDTLVREERAKEDAAAATTASKLFRSSSTRAAAATAARQVVTMDEVEDDEVTD